MAHAHSPRRATTIGTKKDRSDYAGIELFEEDMKNIGEYKPIQFDRISTCRHKHHQRCRQDGLRRIG